MKVKEKDRLSGEWLKLVKEAMESNKSKEEFRAFLEEKKTSTRQNGCEAQ
ncbi:anti-repressor SinI family protein [Niallia oryzisoli]